MAMKGQSVGWPFRLGTCLLAYLMGRELSSLCVINSCFLLNFRVLFGGCAVFLLEASIFGSPLCQLLYYWHNLMERWCHLISFTGKFLDCESLESDVIVPSPRPLSPYRRLLLKRSFHSAVFFRWFMDLYIYCSRVFLFFFCFLGRWFFFCVSFVVQEGVLIWVISQIGFLMSSKPAKRCFW